MLGAGREARTPMKLSRRSFLKRGVIASVGLGATAAVGLAETHELRADRIELALPGLERKQDGLRVAQLSDVHVGPFTAEEHIRAAIELANAFEPDLTVLTGDYVTNDYSGAAAVRERLGGLRSPVVAVLGNHDHRTDAPGVTAALETLGYAVLRNQHTVLTLRGAPFTVVGIDDHSTRHADPARALARAPRGPRLCLAHDPTTAELLDERETPLVLSGHTHGAQLNVLPGLSLLPHLRYKAGLFRILGVQLYVNRGVGNIVVPLRLNAPPEVTLLTLRAAVARR
jgi:predicted MPP superfamily phosphohydrolase